MDDLNPNNDGNKIYETEPGVEEDAAGFSAQAQKDKFLGSSSEKPTPPVENQTVKVPETPVEIKRFSPEQKEALEKQGFVIYGLTGQSIGALWDAGRKFWSEIPAIEALASMQSEVAVNPNKLFLPKSNNKTLIKQEDMVNKFSEGLAKKVPGVAAIIGQAPDYGVLLPSW